MHNRMYRRRVISLKILLVLSLNLAAAAGLKEKYESVVKVVDNFELPLPAEPGWTRLSLTRPGDATSLPTVLALVRQLPGFAVWLGGRPLSWSVKITREVDAKNANVVRYTLIDRSEEGALRVLKIQEQLTRVTANNKSVSFRYDYKTLFGYNSESKLKVKAKTKVEAEALAEEVESLKENNATTQVVPDAAKILIKFISDDAAEASALMLQLKASGLEFDYDTRKQVTYDLSGQDDKPSLTNLLVIGLVRPTAELAKLIDYSANSPDAAPSHALLFTAAPDDAPRRIVTSVLQRKFEKSADAQSRLEKTQF